MGIEASCDWCGGDVDEHDEIACGKCTSKAIADRDEHIAALGQEVEELKQIIAAKGE